MTVHLALWFYDRDMLDKYRAPAARAALALAPIVGSTVLTACGSSGNSAANECITTPVHSHWYKGSATHKGVIATIPRLGDDALGLEVGYKLPHQDWSDSSPITPGFLAKAHQRVVVGIKNGKVRFRFAEVFKQGSGDSSLGSIHLSAPTTKQAQSWTAVSNKGVQPAWPQHTTTFPSC